MECSHTLVHNDGMRVAQRDLLRITSTFQAMKFYYNAQRGEHNISIVGADEHSIMGGKIGIMCVSLLTPFTTVM